jgi:DNA processing protein
MMTSEERAWCAISNSKGIGPSKMWRIAEHLSQLGETASWFLDHPEEMKKILNLRNIAWPIRESAYVASDDVDEEGIRVLHPLHEYFPSRLRKLKDKASLPALLYTFGNSALLGKRGVAIVGSRNAGELALKTAYDLAAQLGKREFNVTSGYAKGIDTAAHSGALKASGTTSIILSEGISGFRQKRELRQFCTLENTVFVSQFKPHAKWAAHFAMTRNKLVCALSHAVVVISSGPERDTNGRMSGTFDAGAAAIAMGIPAFTVDPEFFELQPKGNKELISRGCRRWNPCDGAEPIVKAIDDSLLEESHYLEREKKPAGQMTLFENTN